MGKINRIKFDFRLLKVIYDIFIEKFYLNVMVNKEEYFKIDFINLGSL